MQLGSPPRSRRRPSTKAAGPRGLSEHFSFFDQQTCSLHIRFGFGRGITFDMHDRVYQRGLKLTSSLRNAGVAGSVAI